ncbi:hypothetical protein QL093DRAFT_2552860 [Fusarium oxysporum]|nr:hypothetical protein QL093DRAFT_2552860 [Fusarium oxysporum]
MGQVWTARGFNPKITHGVRIPYMNDTNQLFIMGMLENNDDAVISFEDPARDYESAEIVEILNGKV